MSFSVAKHKKNVDLYIICSITGILPYIYGLIHHSSSKRLPFARFYVDLIRMIMAKFSKLDQENLIATLNALSESLVGHKAKCTINEVMLFLCSTPATREYYRILTGEEHPFLQIDKSYRIQQLILYVFSLSGKSKIHAVRLLCGLIKIKEITEVDVENVFKVVYHLC